MAFVVLEMFLVVSCGQRGIRDVTCGFVWLAWWETFMWFRMASEVLEMFRVAGSRYLMWFPVASVVDEIYCVISCD